MTESYLPEDIIIDLLLRLPVKSLLRFECVCKSWCDLVKSSDFIRKHCDSKKNRARLTVCKCTALSDVRLGVFSFYLLPEKINSGVVFKNQRIGYCEDVTDFRDMYGPVDGLFVLEKKDYIEDERFAWWNPATKTCRTIPKLEFDHLPQFRESHNRIVSVGLDIVNNDYKVVYLQDFSDTRYFHTLYPKVFGALYSLKNDSWKILEPDYPSDSLLFPTLNCTCLNGLYYWMRQSKEGVYSILTFDFATQVFAELEALPIPGDADWVTLMLRGGSLAAMSSNDRYSTMPSSYDIWVRIRENNWMKIFTVNLPMTCNWPCAIWEYDKFVFELTGQEKLAFYDNTTRRVTNLEFDDLELQNSGFCWSMAYKESLVSIKRENPTEEDNIEYFLTKL